MFEAVPQHRDEPAHIASIIERRAEFPHGVRFVDVFKARPFLRLSLLDEVDQRVDVKTRRRVVGVGAFDVAASGRQKCRLDVRFKTSFVCFHMYLPIMLTVKFHTKN